MTGTPMLGSRRAHRAAVLLLLALLGASAGHAAATAGGTAPPPGWEPAVAEAAQIRDLLLAGRTDAARFRCAKFEEIGSPPREIARAVARACASTAAPRPGSDDGTSGRTWAAGRPAPVVSLLEDALRSFGAGAQANGSRVDRP